MWLVTDFHENGSLFEFLTAQTVDMNSMVVMALTIATGLAHLHMDIVGTRGKLKGVQEIPTQINFSSGIIKAKMCAVVQFCQV